MLFVQEFQSKFTKKISTKKSKIKIQDRHYNIINIYLRFDLKDIIIFFYTKKMFPKILTLSPDSMS